MNAPLVSIGIGSYNNAAYIEQLLESVRAQTYPAIELIVVDDCSTDNSAEVITSWIAKTGFPTIFVQHERNQGVVRTFGDCRKYATGEYLSLVGSDDILAPTLIEETVAEFDRQGPTCGAVYTDCKVIDSAGAELSPSFIRYFNPSFADNPPQGNIIVPLLEGFYVPTVTVTTRRAALDEIGEPDESLFSEDLDIWLRLSRSFRFVYLPLNLGAYRVHNKSAVHSHKLSLNETYFRIYRKAYFRGDAEWVAAKKRLAEHAEHYYAGNGPEATRMLWYALLESKQPKLIVFLCMAVLGLKYPFFKRILKR
ncbi:glycosyltransferase [Hymenobacter latericus]|uniref:glycosyltransferase n=1 Tax=Hymenobacter sp. YIM 151858-1 TaxID=2987688 RepID=UPI002225DF9C|nr:glycosyltransferase [Hymenobacter sp. YIM 151858-1]UYZ57449.1 glycosyltransferase [Hymenobacter sp. YIM 151858-1]